MLRAIILVVGWPVLVIGSIFILLKGRAVFNLVKGSLIGKVTQALVYTMLIEMYSLGIVATALMFCNLEIGIYVVLPVFLVWGVVFIWSLKVLNYAQKEATKLADTK